MPGLILLALVAAGCGAAPASRPADPPTADLRQLVPPGSSEALLIERLGAAHVQAGEVHLGEGETETGTVLFPDDPARRVEIQWKDPDNRARPTQVQIYGTESRWSVAPGISLGVALDSLEVLNGGLFELLGFDWDYQGTVMSWREGALEQLRTANTGVVVRLMPSDLPEEFWEEAATVSGEGVFSSAHPGMRRLNPRVYQLIVLYSYEEDPARVRIRSADAFLLRSAAR